jgi:hypothetical protein
MATNLKHSPEGLMEAFEHHVVYEVSMLRHTFNFMGVPAWSTELRNAIIESFCVHARNLIEFFSQKSETAGQADSDYVGAKHFCKSYEPWTKGRLSTELVARLNRQVAHLTYDRTSQTEGKVGPKEQLELLGLIEQEIEIFANSLREPYRSKWPFKDPSFRIPAAVIQNLSATNHTTSVTSRYVSGATGAAGPTPPPVIKP